MSRRNSLLGRFRSISLDRLRTIFTGFDRLESGLDETTLDEIRRELHTMKGEARMLGLARLGEVVHQVEEAFNATQSSASVAPTLTAIREYLGTDLEEGGDESILSKAIELLAGTPSPDADEEPSTADGDAKADGAAKAGGETKADGEAKANGAGEKHADSEHGGWVSARWMSIQSARVDELCEASSGVSARIGGLEARVRSLMGLDHAQLLREVRDISEGLDRCRLRVEEITRSAWALRLIPVEPMLQDLAQHGRELAAALDKQVRVSVDAGGTEMERSILEDLWDPLLHLVRNAIDHGIEDASERGSKPKVGKLMLRAESAGSVVLVSVADDGRGIERESVLTAALDRGLIDQETADSLEADQIIDLLFQHGFSTRSMATEFSGRGVGMDVVSSVVEEMGGSVSVQTDPGAGTKIVLEVPATISKEQAVVVECGDILYAVPSRQVDHIVPLNEDTIVSVAGGLAYRADEESSVLPVRSLRDVLGVDGTDLKGLVITSVPQPFVLGVPTIQGEAYLTRRPMDRLLEKFRFCSASSLLDNGRLVLWITLHQILQKEAVVAVRAPAARGRAARVLVVDDSQIVLNLLSEILTTAEMDVSTALNGREALDSLSEGLPDLILTDLDMPVMDGFTFLSEVRSRHAHVPVIVLTTRASAEDRQRAATLGADAYIAKSEFHESALIDIVRHYLG